MRKLTKHTVIFVLIISLVSIQSTCYAQNMLRKLGRGVSNVLTGFFEVPKSVQEKFNDNGPVAACTYGVIDGVYRFLVRTVVGVYEVATFPLALPEDYAPIVEPEFLFSPDEPYSF